jgi:hypothetical protein
LQREAKAEEGGGGRESLDSDAPTNMAASTIQSINFIEFVTMPKNVPPRVARTSQVFRFTPWRHCSINAACQYATLITVVVLGFLPLRVFFNARRSPNEKPQRNEAKSSKADAQRRQQIGTIVEIGDSGGGVKV